MTAPACFHALPGSTSEAFVRQIATGAPWVKLCDADRIGLARSLGCKVFYRPYLGGDGGAVPEAHAWARLVIDSIHYTGGVWPDVVGFRNEMPATETTALDYLAYRRDLRDAGFPGLVALGSFSTGTPDFAPGTQGGNWDLLAKGLLGQRPDCLELHEYWADAVNADPQAGQWHDLRHLRAIRAGAIPSDLPLFIGEAGRDSPPGSPPGGWQGVIPAEQQAANIRAYLAACAPSVHAVFIFADGTG